MIDFPRRLLIFNGWHKICNRYGVETFYWGEEGEQEILPNPKNNCFFIKVEE